MLAALLTGQSLTESQAETVFEQLLSGSLDEAQIGSLLSLIQVRGATSRELAGAARAMRRHVEPVPFEATAERRLLDTCGTGGAPKTFNVSTAAAIIAAAAGYDQGLRVAKHGNRSRTGRGSAEILSRLGVDIEASPAIQARCLEEAGVCFCFAMRHHPAMRHAAGPRKSLGFPTIFNLLGPLTNPAGAKHQLLGVYDRSRVRPMAEALATLGSARALVVHGSDGLDEMTTTGVTIVAEVDGGVVVESEISAEDYGLNRATMDELRVEDLSEAEAAIRAALAGEAGPRLDLTLWNAAGALYAAKITETLAEALDLSRDAVESGAAERTLEALARVSKG
jgi:anthranilate phosphoribosyltransferase